MLAILAAGAVWTAPLTIATDQPGATVEAAWARPGASGRASCVTPCTLTVPQMAELAVRVRLPGYQVEAFPAVRWAPSLSKGMVLKPASVTLHVTRED